MQGLAEEEAGKHFHIVRERDGSKARCREVEAETPLADRILAGIDGADVPMFASKVKGAPGEQADNKVNIREA